MKKLVSVNSRTGRQLQRYNETGSRQVVGCIPYRYKSTTTDNSSSLCGNDIDNVEVLLISSQKSSRLMFPKGGWETDESIEDAALRETFEEAGVCGTVRHDLGKWDFKSKNKDKFREGHIFAFLVFEELDVWPEKDVRQRQWMTIDNAREACFYSWMKEALNKFAQLMDGSIKKEEKNEVHCSLEFLRIELTEPQNGEKEVDLCVVS